MSIERVNSPGYCDLQVNGYAGVDFNADIVDESSFIAACERLKADGVTGFLGTIISDEMPAMCRRLARLHQLHDQHAIVRELMLGIHVEGPFLNETPGFVGAHPTHAMRWANADDMRQLLDAAGGLTRIVTLAPERDPHQHVTRFLADQGIVVSAGHSDASLKDLRAAIDAGLTMFTHLGNGCPLSLHRHDNIIQRVLSLADSLWIGFIADGVHVPFVALDNYLRAAGIERCFVVTDAIAAAGMGPGTHRLAGQDVIVDANLATWAPDRSHLVGSAMTMPQAVANLKTALRLSTAQVTALTIKNPRAALRIDDA